MPLHVIGYVLPGLFTILAIPMALGMVPPNPYYGFRTAKTLSSPDIWYSANRVAGWSMLVGGIASLCFNLAFWSTHPDWPQNSLLVVMGLSVGATTLVSFLVSAASIRKL